MFSGGGGTFRGEVGGSVRGGMFSGGDGTSREGWVVWDLFSYFSQEREMSSCWFHQSKCLVFEAK